MSTVKTKKRKVSFAEWGKEHISSDFLDLYWDYDKNNEIGINPFQITTKTIRKVWIKCQKDNGHGSYLVSTVNFTSNNSRCPFCSGRKVI